MKIDLGRRRPQRTANLTARTAHLELIAANIDLVDAELQGHAALAAALGVQVPVNWPPGEYDRSALEFFRTRLKAAGPKAVGWYHWYVATRDADDGRKCLVAGAGYMGPPSQEGTVEIGYSVLPQARGRGYATETVTFLTQRALAAGVRQVLAQTLESNAISARVLMRCGFTAAGPGSEPGLIRYQCARLSAAR